MKKLIFLFLMISAIANAQSVNLNIGDSQLKGIAGASFQYENFSIDGGWRPMLLRYPKRWEHSFSGCMTFYSQAKGDAVYISAGGSSAGMLYQGKTSFETESSVLALIGLRYFPHRDMPMIGRNVSFNTGIGVNMARDAVMLAMEFVVNFKMTK